MARQARSEYLNPNEVQVFHITQRCVRQAFLCGVDPVSNQSYEHRRTWIRNRLELLASVFAIDCLTYSIMSNHIHLVLRSRPDVLAAWNDEKVAANWLKLFPKRSGNNKSLQEPIEKQIEDITSDPTLINLLRERLSNISWWMKCLSEAIGRRANKEDNCTGHFWQGRFKAQLILDEASLLACSMYVDLNPIRASMATTPESSNFTGVKDRIDDLKTRNSSEKTSSTHSQERKGDLRKSGWLSPIEVSKQYDPIGPDGDESHRRASRKGFLPISLYKYLQLLDWTGRQIRADKRGSIPSQFAPILSRLGLVPKKWSSLVTQFGRLFKRAAGTAKNIQAEAIRRGQSRMYAPGLSMYSPVVS